MSNKLLSVNSYFKRFPPEVICIPPKLFRKRLMIRGHVFYNGGIPILFITPFMNGNTLQIVKHFYMVYIIVNYYHLSDIPIGNTVLIGYPPLSQCDNSSLIYTRLYGKSQKGFPEGVADAPSLILKTVPAC